MVHLVGKHISLTKFQIQSHINNYNKQNLNPKPLTQYNPLLTRAKDKGSIPNLQ